MNYGTKSSPITRTHVEVVHKLNPRIYHQSLWNKGQRADGRKLVDSRDRPVKEGFVTLSKRSRRARIGDEHDLHQWIRHFCGHCVG